MMGRILCNAGAEPVQDIIIRLYQAGFTLIPMGGDDGKKPLISGWKGRRLPLDAILKRMINGRSQTYAVRLDGMLVVDLDTDNEETRALFASRFPASCVTVRTARGLHHYFRHEGIVPKAVRAEGIAIDFKSGSGQYVLGPGSIRPDGTVYQPVDGQLGATALPAFRDTLPPAGGPKKVPKGERNPALWRRAIEYAPLADDFDGLVGDLVALRDIEFDDAASVPDAEIDKVARWAWQLRLQGNLWSKRNSGVKINRLVLDYLLPRRDGADALALYNLIQSEHGHVPGKKFAIVPDAIIDAGRIGMPRMRVYRARKVLLDAKLLALVKQGQFTDGQRQPDQFRLQSPLVAAALRSQAEGERGRGVSTLISISNVGHGEAA